MNKIIVSALMVGMIVPMVSFAAMDKIQVQTQLVAALTQLVSLYQQLITLTTGKQVEVVANVSQVPFEPAPTQDGWQNVNNPTNFYRTNPYCGENNQFSDPTLTNFNPLCDRKLNPLRAN